MDFQKRFIGRQGFINKQGNIIDPGKHEVTNLERPYEVFRRNRLNIEKPLRGQLPAFNQEIQMQHTPLIQTNKKL